MKVFLVGAKGCGVGGLARALHQPPRSRFLVNAGILPALERLWQATEARVRRPGSPWARPEPPAWVDEAVADFGRLLLRKHTGAAPVIGVAEAGQPVGRLRAWFPGATILHVVRDGLSVPVPISEEPLAAAEAGLAWAQQWSTALATAGGLPRLRFGDIPAALPGLAEALQLPRVGVFAPRPRARLTGAAAEGFACCAPAVAEMTALGLPVPAPGPMTLAVPALAAARARGLIDGGQPGAALALLGQTAVSHPVLLDALAAAYLACGDEAAAAAAWAEAVAQPGAPQGAWIRLLSLSHRPESLAAARCARTSPDDVVRAAAARWMVARGMDHEAAEAVSRVHGQRWYLPAG